MQQPVNGSERTRDRDMTEYLYVALRVLPDTIGQVEFDGAMLVNALRESKANLEDAELNATLNAAMPEKSNADSRKLIIEATLAKDGTVQKYRKEVMRIEGEIETNEADAKTKRREFQAAIALSELHAARINMMCHYQHNNTTNERKPQ